jgi:cytochrome P450
VENGAGYRAPTGGFWAVTRHPDNYSGFRMPDELISGQGVFYEEVPDEVRVAVSFLAMDEPRHGQLRRLVSAGFTPKRISYLEEMASMRARTIVDDMISAGPGDFVEQVSARLPIELIADMIGIEGEFREWFSEKVDDWLDWNAPGKTSKYGVDHPGEVMINAVKDMGEAFTRMAHEQRRTPREGFVTALVNAEIDGQRLSDEEIANFLTLLVGGGADTTKQALSHTMAALTEFPQAKNALVEDYDAAIGTAVDEMLRWATVAPALKRTAATDTELGGQHISKGEKVVLFTASANRDETVFPDPWNFDIYRAPNKHAAFGGGLHHCLGSALAKMELTVMFREILFRLPHIEAGDIRYGDSSHINTVRSLQCSF